MSRSRFWWASSASVAIAPVAAASMRATSSSGSAPIETGTTAPGGERAGGQGGLEKPGQGEHPAGVCRDEPVELVGVVVGEGEVEGVVDHDLGVYGVRDACEPRRARDLAEKGADPGHDDRVARDRADRDDGHGFDTSGTDGLCQRRGLMLAGQMWHFRPSSLRCWRNANRILTDRQLLCELCAAWPEDVPEPVRLGCEPPQRLGRVTLSSRGRGSIRLLKGLSYRFKR